MSACFRNNTRETQSIGRDGPSDFLSQEYQLKDSATPARGRLAKNCSHVSIIALTQETSAQNPKQ